MSESKIEKLIREYLLEEGLLRKRINDSKIDFGYQFAYPPGTNSHVMAVFKPKDKDLIILSSGTQISPPHVEALNSLKDAKKFQYFNDLRKFFLLKDVFFRIDIKHHRYEISDQKFLKEDEHISKNALFELIRKVFNCAAYSNIILSQYCINKMDDDELDKYKDFTSSNFSLYT
ncbi:MAG: DUF2299 domain-containing protein [Promethearchaeota archaeon]|nr:MAG: DUF2299 domain-containing protein [Candidatus Lokiarchaeota archaeon]